MMPGAEGRTAPLLRRTRWLPALVLLLPAASRAARCEPIAGTPRLRCLTADGIDLAEAALYNGLGRVTPEASDAYRYAELAAREARRGIWKAEISRD